jgi:hypothetical protein
MALATCPPPADLEHLVLGGRPAEEIDELERHVLTCATCLAQLKTQLTGRDTLAGLGGHTRSDESAASPVIVALMRKLESLRSSSAVTPSQGAAMISLTCDKCHKKLVVKPQFAGKKVKCPACGAVMPVAAAVHVADAVSVGQSSEDLPTVPPPQADASEQPTNPPASAPDCTHAFDQSDDGASLIDFLAPPEAKDELGRLGKYRILQVLGHGGMGVVYRAEDPKLKRTVAIKAMLPTLAASASAGKRFLREAEAMAGVEHDHIVRIYQIDEERGVPFLAMEFLKGESLDSRLRNEKPVPLGEVLRIGREIGEGLAAAHATGLIHRDIKPGNIWLEAPRNRVKILDFGLARAASQESGLTQQGAIIGTPAYMAPEQGRGDAVDVRCDLFSLGVVLYRLSTGQLPFKGADTVSTLMAVATYEPAAPGTMNPELPPAFSELVMKLLEKEPGKRVATAAEVVQALALLEKQQQRQREAEQATQAEAFVPLKGEPSRVSGRAATSRHRFAFVAAALVALAGVTVAGVIFYWQTDNGTVRIEINDPEIQVAFDKKELIFKGVDDKQELRVATGEHGLHVKRGNLEFDSDKPIVIKRGDTVTLRVEWLKDGKLQIVRDGKVSDAQAANLARVPADAAMPVDLPVASTRYALRFGPTDRVEMTSFKDHEGPLTVEVFATVLEKPVTKYGLVIGIGPGASGRFAQGATVLKVSAGGKWTLQGDPDNQGVQSIGLLGQRTHVAFVRTDAELRLYVDGKFIGAQPLSAKPARGRILLGSGSLVGLIDGVRVSKTARYDKSFAPPTRFAKDGDTSALYQFDEGAGDTLKDTSGNQYDGRIIGAKWVKAETPTQVNYALQFEPGNKVDVRKITLDVKAPLTIEAYVNAQEVPPGTFKAWPGNGVLHLTRYGVSIGVRRETSGHYWNFRVAGDEGTKLIDVKAPRVTYGKFVHVAAVKTDKALRLYLDGKLVDVKDRPDVPLHQGGDILALMIGSIFIGTIDEIRVSKVARYDRDFTSAKRFEPDADTVALYHCDEGSGDMLKDSSQNGYHGKVIGAKWVKRDDAPIDLPAAAPDLSKAAPFYDARLDKPVAGWLTEAKGFYHQGFEDGRYFIAVDPGSTRSCFCPAKPIGDFVCEVVGRATGGPAAAWALEIQNVEARRYLYFKLNGKQEIEILADQKNADNFTTIGPIRHAAIKPGEVFNTLRVVMRGETIEVYVNGVAVYIPIATNFVKTPATFGVLALAAKDRAGRAEFERLTIWPASVLPSADIPKEAEGKKLDKAP